jgi:predicted amidohydrolase
MSETIRAAAVQLNSTADKARNVETAERLVRAAAADGAELIVLPEKWNVLGDGQALRDGAEALDGPTLTAARDWARELGVFLVAGSIAERVEGREKLANTSVLIDREGVVAATYRKIHMFDVEVEGVTYFESEHEEAGAEAVIARAGDLPLGLTICYDLRFPELYRALAVEGALAITVPSAFTAPTGRAHWEVLLRARAVEDQVFVVAANQVGESRPDHESWGHSMIVDPWGRVIAEAPDEECFVAADLDLGEQEEIRKRLPSLRHRQPDAYRVAAEAHR